VSKSGFSRSKKALIVKLPDGWSREQASFDDENLVSCAGLVPVVIALAERAGLSELVAIKATAVASAGVNPASKLTSIIAGMAAGADSIDDLQVIRSGGMPRLFGEVYAPATLGQFHLRPWPAVGVGGAGAPGQPTGASIY
jgi:hypothetical protein